MALDTTEAQALKALTALLPTGRLRIITSEVADEVKDLATLHVNPTLAASPEEAAADLNRWREHYRTGTTRTALIEKASRGGNREFRLAVLGVPALPGTDLTKAASFVVLPVERIEEHPTKPGMYVAFTEQHFGAATFGAPSVLLRRLQEWAR